VVTGPSGSGKSSLVFDTLYAEGQRRYVETFSAYARQFLDRMDKPAVDKVEGVPPAIAIDQTNPVRSSRSTVGTMTELNDHLKLLFARAGQLFDRRRAARAARLARDHLRRAGSALPALGGRPAPGADLPGRAACQHQRRTGRAMAVGQRLYQGAGRARSGHAHRARARCWMWWPTASAWAMPRSARAIEAIEVALKRGSGRLNVYRLVEDGRARLWRFSTGLHCPDSDLRYSDPIPVDAFSFNSAVGACDTCRGFGRVIGVDWGLVIPNDKLTLRAGAIKTIQTPAWKEAQDDLMRHAEAAGIPRDTPWYKLTRRAEKVGDQRHRRTGTASGTSSGTASSAFLNTWRARPTRCTSACCCPSTAATRRAHLCAARGSRPKACSGASAARKTPMRRCRPAKRFMPEGVQWTRAQLEALPGLCLHDLMLLPIDRLRQFFARMQLPVGDDAKRRRRQALKLLHEEITTRLKYLCDVGIGYLTLDRQSRTLSGGEVQRINLTTALGTSLVNTCLCWTSPASACTRATCTASPRPCCACAMRATRWWWWSTTRP
jgi:excinuclease ABC subunit A